MTRPEHGIGSGIGPGKEFESWGEYFGVLGVVLLAAVLLIGAMIGLIYGVQWLFVHAVQAACQGGHCD